MLLPVFCNARQTLTTKTTIKPVAGPSPLSSDVTGGSVDQSNATDAADLPQDEVEAARNQLKARVGGKRRGGKAGRASGAQGKVRMLLAEKDSFNNCSTSHH